MSHKSLLYIYIYGQFYLKQFNGHARKDEIEKVTEMNE